MKTKLPFFETLTIIVLFFATSCDKAVMPKEMEKQCTINTTKPIFNTNDIASLPQLSCNEKVCGLLPLAKNYQWIYIDSIFDNNGQFTKTEFDTLRIEKNVQSSADNSIWWKITSRRYKGLPNYIFTTDSTLYSMDVSYGGSNAVIKATNWLQVLSQDSVRKTNMLSDMGYIETVKKLNTPITVNACTYSGCINVVKHLSNNYDITFKPEIGILKFASYAVTGNPFTVQPANKRQVSVLVQVIK